MATVGEHAKQIAEDKRLLETKRIRIILDYRENGHKIQHMTGEWHVIENGQDPVKAARFALEKMLEEGHFNQRS